jgi:hypothetical protein
MERGRFPAAYAMSPLRGDSLSPEDAAERATRQLGQAVDLRERFSLGDEGAYQVEVGGIPRVFKYWAGERAAALRLTTAVAAHGVLQDCGWPLPTLYAWHSSPDFAFILEEQLPGERVDAVPEALCQQLLALLDAVPSGAGCGIGDAGDWLTFLEQSLYRDLPLSPCRPLHLQRSAAGRRFVAHAQAAFAPARAELAAARDVIHGDFSAGNVLCDHRGTLTAVLDWQRASVSHRAFDLIGLEWDLALRLDVGSAPSLARVAARVEGTMGAAVSTFFRAYYAVWNLSWALDTEDEATVLHAAAAVGVP